MYINFWYPMATSEELEADKALKAAEQAAGIAREHRVRNRTLPHAACSRNERRQATRPNGIIST